MRIDLGGRTAGFDDTGGTGVPLVLIHGFPLDRTVWAAQSRGLAGTARVIAPDLRGFLGSAGGPEATSIADYADDLAALLDALRIGDAVIGGVSMGGYVAMAFHRNYPARVRGLVLADTRGGADSADGRAARDAAIALARTEGTRAIAGQMIGKMLTPANSGPDAPLRRDLVRMMESQPAPGVIAALRAMRDRPDSMPSLDAVRVPTLVVTGAEDKLIPPSEAEALRRAIRNARLVSIEGAAHLPNFEQPEAFNRAVREFLAALE